MPGTTYSRTGPSRDAVGRLADFARFAVAELGEILADSRPAAGTAEVPAEGRAIMAREQLAAVAELLDGYTTADD